MDETSKDHTTEPSIPRDSVEQLLRDETRIGAEIAGTDGGFDPFPAAVRATRMPMVITNPRLPDNPIVFVNEAFCRLTGYDREEILGRNCRFLQGGETDPDDVARLREALAVPRAVEMDIRNYRKDGTPFWNRLLLAPVTDAAGALAYFFASQLDVTLDRDRLCALETQNAILAAERQASRERLAFSEVSHQLAVAAAEIGTWDLDLSTGVLTWSDRTKAMFGISPDVPCSMDDFYGGLHAEDRDATVAAFASALDPLQRATYDVEYRTVGKEDGLVRWVAAKGRGLFDEGGRCLRALGTAIDITRRRQADEALRANEARLRFLDDLGVATAKSVDADAILATTTRMVAEHLSLSNCAYADMDPDEDGFTIRGDWAAPGSPSIVGHYSLAAFGRRAVRDLGAGEPLIVNDNLAELAPEEAATFQAIGIAATICMPLIKDGRLTALMAIHDRVPRTWTAHDLTLVREVTERCWAHIERVRADAAVREAVDALAALNATLEEQVAARTGDLMAAEEALRQAQKMEAVGQLTGGLAHDFNNLLAGISGALELMQTRMQQGRFNDVERYMAAAQGASKRAAALTHRLLAFSRRQTLDPKPTDVNRLVADMRELIQRTVGPAIPIDVAAAAGIWPALVDPSQLENALLNLCINARDAMPEGGRITVETANTRFDAQAARGHDMPPGQYLCLSVTDTGIGMPPEVVERVFEPFFTTKPIGQGTGLGLSMIYGFAQQSGGEVRITSEVGKGTTVCIYLPRHEGEIAPEEAPTDIARLPRSVQGETVLVVDDESTVRMLIADVLADLGYTAIEASDSAAGLRVLESDVRIDLLITDVGLPGGMNGRQMADAARARRPALKVLFITGYAENAAVGNGSLAPGMAVLTKPFAIETMAARIRSMIGT
ncbi:MULTISPECIES: PAS domain-containing protein [unclassified Methylobacterium]|uniref:PAS domain-containing protein n=1 Tax=unclassified Methylobacterium TaxID=2615210 RepID=UPI0006F28112|nr:MULTISPECIES: PAS domain-containing protein [unclassified Methylobacterium]KQP60668.1 histidine kinase [Methylobacterium sp. Leaf108]KQT78420.1 histidine kinase [Methylobacterium sp. Leaf466]